MVQHLHTRVDSVVVVLVLLAKPYTFHSKTFMKKKTKYDQAGKGRADYPTFKAHVFRIFGTSTALSDDRKL